MHVTETVEYQYVIPSDRKEQYRRLERLAEQARVRGDLVITGVSDVQMYLEEVRRPGTKVKGQELYGLRGRVAR